MAPYRTELVVGIVAPTGVSFDSVAKVVREEFRATGYRVESIRLSAYLGRLATAVAGYADDRIEGLQTAGDELRAANGPDALSYLAAAEIRGLRSKHWAGDKAGRGEDDPVSKTVYLVWSIKHPAEAERLRKVYRERFVLLSISSPRSNREQALTAKIAQSRNATDREESFRSRAIELIDRDEAEPGRIGKNGELVGQNVRDAYPLADFFLDASSPSKLRASMKRVVESVFGFPFATPTRDEFGMYVAHAASLRSSEMGRQVGAAICSVGGDVIATGTNEVPAPGGGHYWSGDEPDAREFRQEFDTNDRMKRQVAEQLAGVIEAKSLLAEQAADRETIVTALLEGSRLSEIIEFGRAVHAEMSALMDAARRGVAVAGATMYVTTFPCHLCTRLVIAAGITRLVYIYPYAKSLAMNLYREAISTDPSNAGSRVLFEPFLGVSPRQYPTVFAMPKRKEKDGSIVSWDPHSAVPRATDDDEAARPDVPEYLMREQLAVITATCLGSEELVMEAEA